MDFVGFLFGVATFLLAILIIYYLYVKIPMEMAENRGRDPYKWLIVSIFFSPFVAIFLLWLLEDR